MLFQNYIKRVLKALVIAFVMLVSPAFATTYNITYGLNGGSLPSGVSNPVQYYVDGDTLYYKYDVNDPSWSSTNSSEPLATPSKADNVFLGWCRFTSAQAAADANYNCLIGVRNLTKSGASDLYFYAKWAPIYTITYNLGGASWVSSGTVPVRYYVDRDTVYYKYDANASSWSSTTRYDLEAVSKNGFTYNGWCAFDNVQSNSDCQDPIYSFVAGSSSYSNGLNLSSRQNLYLYAKLTPIEYTITYNNMAGATNNVNNPATYTIADSTITLADPTKNGYTFGGWYSDSTLENSVTTIPQGSTGNKTLYAKWTPVTYNITYNLDSGTNNANNPATYNITSSTITLQDPNKANYKFMGWYDNAQFTGSAITTIPNGSTGNITLYAKWEAFVNKFQITTTDTIVSDGTGSNDYFAFGMSAAGVFYVDWGDGTIERIDRTNNTTRQMYSHTYTNTTARSYDIKFDGLATGYNDTTASTPAIEFGGFSDISVNENKSVSCTDTKVYRISGSLGAIFPTIGGAAATAGLAGNSAALWAIQPRFSGAFYYCSNLTGSIPAGLFSGIEGQPAQHMFSGMFYLCENLGKDTIDGTSTYYIPATLFAGIDTEAIADYPMSNIFYYTDLLAFCPSGTIKATTGVENYFGVTSSYGYAVACVETDEIYCKRGLKYDSTTHACAVCDANDTCDAGFVQECPTGYLGNTTSATGYDDGSYATRCIAVNYDINYYMRGGTNNANNPSTYTVESSTITLQDPTKTGYKFGGWYDNYSLTGSAITEIVAGSTGNKSLYAKWVPAYNIHYYEDANTAMNGSPVQYSVIDDRVYYRSSNQNTWDSSSTYISLVDSSNNFGGWCAFDSAEEAASENYTCTNPIRYLTANSNYTGSVYLDVSSNTGDLYLYAVPAYTIHYNYMGATPPAHDNPVQYFVSGGDTVIYETGVNGYWDSTTGSVGFAEPSKGNDDFLGWCVFYSELAAAAANYTCRNPIRRLTANSSYTGSQYLNVSAGGDLYLYAKWPYNIYYNDMGATTPASNNPVQYYLGSGASLYYKTNVNNSSWTADTRVDLSSPSGNGNLSFIGWCVFNSAEDATAANYTCTDPVNSMVLTDENVGAGVLHLSNRRDLYLYAKWVQAYTIHYDNGVATTNAAGNIEQYWVDANNRLYYKRQNSNYWAIGDTTYAYFVGSNPSRNNYVFKGWCASKVASANYTCAEPKTTLTANSSYTGSSYLNVSDGGDLYLYAKLLPIYNVYYDSMGAGTLSYTPMQYYADGNRLYYKFNDSSYWNNTMYSMSASAPSKVEDDGYSFGGWCKFNSAQDSPEAYSVANDCNDPIQSLTANSSYTGSQYLNVSNTENLYLYAKWTPTTYYITYNNMNGATNNPNNPESYTIESSDITLATPTKTGYTFGGWYDNDQFTGDAITEIESGSTGDVTLYAKWTLTDYTITYNLYGGTNNASNRATYTYVDAITLYDPTKPGYTFGGWYDNDQFTGSRYTVIYSHNTGNRTFYAKWTPTVYSIYYHNMDNAGHTNPIEYTVESSLITLQDPTKDYYTFGGWYSDSGLTNAITTIDPANSIGGMDVYAKWTEVLGECNSAEYAGRYDSNNKQYLCDPCPADHYCPGGNNLTINNNGSHACPSDTHSESGVATSAADCSVCPRNDNFEQTANINYELSGLHGVWKDLNGDRNQTIDECVMPVMGFSDMIEAYKCVYQSMMTPEQIQAEIGQEAYEAYGFDQPCDYSSLDAGVMLCRYNSSSNDYTNCSSVTSFCDSAELASKAFGESDSNAMITWALSRRGLNQSVADWRKVFNVIDLTDSNANVITDGTYCDASEITQPSCTVGQAAEFKVYTNGTIEATCVSCPLGSYCPNADTYTFADSVLVSEGNSYNTYLAGNVACLGGMATTSTGSTSVSDCIQTCMPDRDANGVLYANRVPAGAHILGNAQLSGTTKTPTVGTFTDRNNNQYQACANVYFSVLDDTVFANGIANATDSELAKAGLRMFMCKYNTATGKYDMCSDMVYALCNDVMSMVLPLTTSELFGLLSDTMADRYLTRMVNFDSQQGYMACESECDTGYYIEGTYNGNKYNITGNTCCPDGYACCLADHKYDTATGKCEVCYGSTCPTTYTKSLKTYAITYNNMTGATNNANNPATYTVTDSTITLATPTKNGYTFGGWYSDSTLENVVTTINPANSPNGVTVYAKWTAIPYNITYNLDGGTNNVNNPSTYTAETPDITLADPTKTGYTFGGWYDNDQFTGDAITEIESGSTGAKTFYARWTLDTYTITYNLDGGTNDVNNPVSYTVESSDITLGAPTKSGFVFGGWYDNALFSNSAITGITTGSTTGDKTFYAKWLQEYTITYNLDGGTNNVSNPATYTVETPDITLADPTKTGYTFGGWYDDDKFANAVTEIVPANSTVDPVVLYAKWTPIQYTVTYVLDGGSNEKNNPETYTIEDNLITLNNPTKTGYTFAGWYSDNGWENAASTIPSGSTGNKTFYARWTLDTYTITYNLDGGTNNVSNPATYTVEDLPITLGNPTKSGSFIFGGWSLFGKETVTEIKAGTAGNITLDAEWLQEYTVSYVLDGGTNNPNNPSTYTTKDTPIQLAAPTKSGYIFDGWYYNNTTYDKEATHIYSGDGDITLYAKWRLFNNKFQITTTPDIVSGYSGNKDRFSFSMSAAGVFYVDWGDGSEIEIIDRTNNTSVGYYSHTYKNTTARSYDIKFDGLATGYNSSWFNSVSSALSASSAISFYIEGEVPSANEQGNVTGSQAKVAGISGSLGALFPTIGGKNATKDSKTGYWIGGDDNRLLAIQPRFAYTFNDCTNLTGSIPVGLFSGIEGQPAQYMFTETFFDCYNLTGSIPAGLFSGIEGWPAEKMFYGTFESCTGLGRDTVKGSSKYYIPATLFAGIDSTYHQGDGLASMLYVVYASGLRTSCPGDTNQAITGFDSDFDGKVACVDYETVYCRKGYRFDTTTHACVQCQSGDTCPERGAEYDCSQYGMIADTNAMSCVASAVYNITYNLDGGTNSLDNPSVYTGEVAITLAAPTKYGYTFGGWYSDSTLENAVSTIPQGSTGAKTFYAKWTPATTNSIHYYYNTEDAVNGVSGEVEQYYVDGDYIYYKRPNVNWNRLYKGSTNAGVQGFGSDGDLSTVFSTSEPSRGNYAFLGWCAFDSVSDAISANYTCTYPVKYLSGPYPASGYLNSVEYLNVSNRGDLYLYAQWSPRLRTIHFNGMGATTTLADSEQYYVSGQYVYYKDNLNNQWDYVYRYYYLPTPSKGNNFGFAGWCVFETEQSDPADAVANYCNDLRTMMHYTYLSDVENDLYLYAKWTPIHTIHYNDMGATTPASGNPTQYYVGYNYRLHYYDVTNGYWDDASSVTLNTPSKGNDTMFLGWCAFNTEQNNPANAVADNNCTNANLVAGVAATGTDSTYISSGILYISENDASDWYLYARWSPIYTIHSYLDSTSQTEFSGNPVQYYVGTIDPIYYNYPKGLCYKTDEKSESWSCNTSSYTLATPSRNNFGFLGWCRFNSLQEAASENYTCTYPAQVISTISYGIDISNGGDQYLYAQWTPQLHTIHYYNMDADTGATGNPTQYVVADGRIYYTSSGSYSYSATTMRLNNPSKDNFGFAGWCVFNSEEDAAKDSYTCTDPVNWLTVDPDAVGDGYLNVTGRTDLYLYATKWVQPYNIYYDETPSSDAPLQYYIAADGSLYTMDTYNAWVWMNNDYDSLYEPASNPNNLVFAGWCAFKTAQANPNCTDPVTILASRSGFANSEDVSDGGDRYLYAKWIQPHTIHYNGMGVDINDLHNPEKYYYLGGDDYFYVKYPDQGYYNTIDRQWLASPSQSAGFAGWCAFDTEQNDSADAVANHCDYLVDYLGLDQNPYRGLNISNRGDLYLYAKWVPVYNIYYDNYVQDNPTEYSYDGENYHYNGTASGSMTLLVPSGNQACRGWYVCTTQQNDVYAAAADNNNCQFFSTYSGYSSSVSGMYNSNLYAYASFGPQTVSCSAGQYAYYDGVNLYCQSCPENSYCDGKNLSGGSDLTAEDNGKYTCGVRLPDQYADYHKPQSNRAFSSARQYSSRNSTSEDDCSACPEPDVMAVTSDNYYFMSAGDAANKQTATTINECVASVFGMADMNEAQKCMVQSVMSADQLQQQYGDKYYEYGYDQPCDLAVADLGLMSCRYNSRTGDYSDCSSMLTPCDMADAASYFGPVMNESSAELYALELRKKGVTTSTMNQNTFFAENNLANPIARTGEGTVVKEFTARCDTYACLAGEYARIEYVNGVGTASCEPCSAGSFCPDSKTYSFANGDFVVDPNNANVYTAGKITCPVASTSTAGSATCTCVGGTGTASDAAYMPAGNSIVDININYNNQNMSTTKTPEVVKFIDKNNNDAEYYACANVYTSALNTAALATWQQGGMANDAKLAEAGLRIAVCKYNATDNKYNECTPAFTACEFQHAGLMLGYTTSGIAQVLAQMWSNGKYTGLPDNMFTKVSSTLGVDALQTANACTNCAEHYEWESFEAGKGTEYTGNNCCPDGYACCLAGSKYNPDPKVARCEECSGASCPTTYTEHVVCPSGTYIDQSAIGTNAQCVECPVGHYCPGVSVAWDGQSTLTDTAAGKFECADGSYADKTGMTACSLCAGGMSTGGATGSTSDLACSTTTCVDGSQYDPVGITYIENVAKQSDLVTFYDTKNKEQYQSCAKVYVTVLDDTVFGYTDVNAETPISMKTKIAHATADELAQSGLRLIICGYDAQTNKYTECSNAIPVCDTSSVDTVLNDTTANITATMATQYGMGGIPSFIMGEADASGALGIDGIRNFYGTAKSGTPTCAASCPLGTEWESYIDDKNNETYYTGNTCCPEGYACCLAGWKYDEETERCEECSGSDCPTTYTKSLACPAGTYIDEAHIGTASQCADCPAGSYCPGVVLDWDGEPGISDAEAGKFSCQANQFSGVGATSCTACPVASTSTAGSATCTCVGGTGTASDAAYMPAGNSIVDININYNNQNMSTTKTPEVVKFIDKNNNDAEYYACANVYTSALNTAALATWQQGGMANDAKLAEAGLRIAVCKYNATDNKYNECTPAFTACEFQHAGLMLGYTTSGIAQVLAQMWSNGKYTGLPDNMFTKVSSTLGVDALQTANACTNCAEHYEWESFEAGKGTEYTGNNCCPDGYACCLAGSKYNPDPKVARCEECSGASCPTTYTEHVVCPSGTYIDQSAIGTNAQCVECPVGHYCPGVSVAWDGQSTLTDTAAGKFECADGSYADKTGMTACSLCAGGMSTGGATGSTSDLACSTTTCVDGSQYDPVGITYIENVAKQSDLVTFYDTKNKEQYQSCAKVYVTVLDDTVFGYTDVNAETPISMKTKIAHATADELAQSGLRLIICGYDAQTNKYTECSNAIPVCDTSSVDTVLNDTTANITATMATQYGMGGIPSFIMGEADASGALGIDGIRNFYGTAKSGTPTCAASCPLGTEWESYIDDKNNETYYTGNTCCPEGYACCLAGWKYDEETERCEECSGSDCPTTYTKRVVACPESNGTNSGQGVIELDMGLESAYGDTMDKCIAIRLYYEDPTPLAGGFENLTVDDLIDAGASVAFCQYNPASEHENYDGNCTPKYSICSDDDLETLFSDGTTVGVLQNMLNLDSPDDISDSLFAKTSASLASESVTNRCTVSCPDAGDFSNMSLSGAGMMQMGNNMEGSYGETASDCVSMRVYYNDGSELFDGYNPSSDINDWVDAGASVAFCKYNTGDPATDLCTPKYSLCSDDSMIALMGAGDTIGIMQTLLGVNDPSTLGTYFTETPSSLESATATNRCSVDCTLVENSTGSDDGNGGCGCTTGYEWNSSTGTCDGISVSISWAGVNEPGEAETCTYGGDLSTPTAPKLNGYAFAGWTVGRVVVSNNNNDNTEEQDNGEEIGKGE